LRKSAEAGFPEVQVQKCRLFTQPGAAKMQIPENANAGFEVQKAEVLALPPSDLKMTGAA
jgi:hypothetical protein